MEPAGLHPSDRADRAGPGATGEAISLVCIDETDLLRGVQRMLKQAIPWTVEEGFIPDRDTRAAAAWRARRPRAHDGRRITPTGSRVRRRAGAGSGSGG